MLVYVYTRLILIDFLKLSLSRIGTRQASANAENNVNEL